jgi:hypothetical protein
MKMDIGEIGWGVMERIIMAQDRDQLRAEHDNEPSGSIKFCEFFELLSSS